MNPDGTPIRHEQFLAMLEAQQYRCAICGAPVTSNSPLDHNHETGEPRGILCHQCNMSLGWLEPHLATAQAYLQLATKTWDQQDTDEGPFGDPRTPEEKALDIRMSQPDYEWKNPFTGEPLKHIE